MGGVGDFYLMHVLSLPAHLRLMTSHGTLREATERRGFDLDAAVDVDKLCIDSGYRGRVSGEFAISSERMRSR